MMEWPVHPLGKITLAALLIACLPAQLPAQQLPHLITPDPRARRDAEGVPLPEDASRRLGSGLFRCDQ